MMFSASPGACANIRMPEQAETGHRVPTTLLDINQYIFVYCTLYKYCVVFAYRLPQRDVVATVAHVAGDGGGREARGRAL